MLLINKKLYKAHQQFPALIVFCLQVAKNLINVYGRNLPRFMTWKLKSLGTIGAFVTLSINLGQVKALTSDRKIEYLDFSYFSKV